MEMYVKKAKIKGVERFTKAFLNLPTNTIALLLDCDKRDIKPGDIIRAIPTKKDTSNR